MLQDQDFNTAYSLMVKASNELANMEKQLSDFIKQKDEFEKDFEATFSRLSIKYDPNKAATGDRKAKYDTEYLKEKDTIIMAKKLVRDIQAIVNHLTRIYYDTQKVYANANRKYREGRD